MIESARPNIPTLTLRGKDGVINIGRETIRMLNYPSHITILQCKRNRSFAVFPCSPRHVMSFATPENFLVNRNRKFTITSKEYTHDLMKSCDLECDKTYQFIGVHEEAKHRVVFYLEEQLNGACVNCFVPRSEKNEDNINGRKENLSDSPRP